MNIKFPAMPNPPVTIQDWLDLPDEANALGLIKASVEAERASKNVAWISLATPEQLDAQWNTLQTKIKAGQNLPLRGVPFAVKDNIDATGFQTTAACPAFAGLPATEDASVVANIKNAGAILIGKTNLDQFATGLVGTRSPYGAVPNSHDPSKVSGGSSSGSAVVVARGIVPFSLGTDTAGSGRVPAGLNNIVGLKPSRGCLSTRGVLPACKSLDCVSIFAMTIKDAETVLSAAEGYDAKDSYSRQRPRGVKTDLGDMPSVAICADPPWFGFKEQEAAYNASLEKARAMGWKLTTVDFTPLFALANLLYEGPWVAERYEAIRKFIESVPAADMDPTVRGIIMKAPNFNAADAFAGVYERQELTRAIEEAFGSFDLILVPTTPTFPSIADLAREPVLENSRLGTYTNFVNFLDMSALSVPAGYRSDGLPFGITVIARTWQEPLLLNLASQWLSGSPRTLGATGVLVDREPALASLNASINSDRVEVVVVGAHLAGLPLNKDLVSRGAAFKAASTTSPMYRLYALATTGPVRKPGLRRVGPNEQGTAIQVESWLLPTNQLASFAATITHPLGLGSVELLDGSWKLGFICEPLGLEGATDISDFGGWRAYMKHVASSSPSNNNTKPSKGIKKILIANRGEIAVRIISTLRKINVASIAIYSRQDSTAPHVSLADEAFELTGHSVPETYLNSTQILDVARRAGADAVIPGYGFLSENADFAAAVEQAGLKWIGPTPQQMRDLGLKHTSRDIAAGAGVPVVPGSEKLLKSLEEAVEAGDQIGYPLMLKSTAGGGGIGITRCADSEALREAWESTQRLAKANFGNDGVFLEKFISEARHIEVQIIGDGTGKVLTVGERDCSLQRRHQKLVEESPAPGLSDDVRQRMATAAANLAAAVKYRNVGTVEFIYDKLSDQFYFLEVNTRLQVEHPITESVSGLDLVKCMVDVANGACQDLFATSKGNASVTGTSIEVRLYAESPLQQFRPTSGRLLDVQFPSHVRVDTWVTKGTMMSSSYDPLIAKIIATGQNREEALENMVSALRETKICGIETNLQYLLQLVSAPWYLSADYSTNLLDNLAVDSTAFEVLEPGPATTVQDYPGRKGLWHAGIPPSGPMDNYSARLANSIVGNAPEAAVLECSIQGPALKFHTDCKIAVAGAICTVKVDGEPASLNEAIRVNKGQTLHVVSATAGSRMYIAFQGGLDVPLVMGSRSTLEIAKFGGHNGRKLQKGDILRVGDGSAGLVDDTKAPAPAAPISTQPNSLWTIGAVAGPHGAPDYFTEDGLATLFAAEWKVHYNSNRLGVRLTGPNPQWARSTGGQAGLHPSNIHDSPYSVGSVSFTGDEAVVLTCDGPSLGGFVVWCVVAEAEMWKMGQLRPGDRVKFELISPSAAIAAHERVTRALQGTEASIEAVTKHDEDQTSLNTIPSAIVGQFVRDSQKITVRQAGDHAMLLVFGEVDGFDLRQSLAIFAFIDEHKRNPIRGVEELTPGVRTLHLTYTMGLLPEEVLTLLQQHEYKVPSTLPSRKIRLPFAFDDETCKKAVERYRATIRSEAPWLPSNIKFLQELNGLDDGDVGAIMHEAEFLVLGLGDVYMGSPCAVPLDPRHRLMGTKYNPSRSFTPRNAVGLGGQYMCIYATESPGGYQLLGRTAGIWDETKVTYHYGENGDKNWKSAPKPWKFRAFDRISFYPVTDAELDNAKDDMIFIEEDRTLDLAEYDSWLEAEKDSIEKITQSRLEAFSSAPYLDDLLRPAPARPGEGDGQARALTLDGEALPVGEVVRAVVPGRCFRVAAHVSDEVNEGDALAWVESNKMELKIISPVKGRVVMARTEAGDLLDANEVMFVVAKDG